MDENKTQGASAQGAGAPENKSAGNTSEQTVNKSAAETNVRPSWIDEVLASNNSVIESNNALIDAIGAFRESAGTIVEEVVKQAQSAILTANTEPLVVRELPKVKSKAKYVVSKGKKFQDKDNSEVEYTEGYDITHIGKDRIANLLSQGIIEEAKKGGDAEEEDDD
ncbi:hypothetical protein GCM10023149_48500 [Mucilaginibacter gynuensis]|uniref:Uncharacterized protein n=1 Tax=Mucilaginibacter gynuensis TaxID=1302236 RepID=A0ABP8HFP3_9SPHI